MLITFTADAVCIIQRSRKCGRIVLRVQFTQDTLSVELFYRFPFMFSPSLLEDRVEVGFQLSLWLAWVSGLAGFWQIWAPGQGEACRQGLPTAGDQDCPSHPIRQLAARHDHFRFFTAAG
jgi:hypothetical protein